MNFFRVIVFLLSLFIFNPALRAEESTNNINEYAEIAKMIGEGFAEGLAGKNNIGEKLGAGLIDGFFENLTNLKKMDKYSKELGKIQEIFGKDIIDAQRNNLQYGRKTFFEEISTTVKEFWKNLDENLSTSTKDGIEIVNRNSADFAKGIRKGFGAGSEPQKAFSDVVTTFVGTIQRNLFMNTGKYIALGLVPVYGVRYGYQYFVKKLNDPRIIIETSIGSWPYEYAKWIFRFRPRKAKEKLADMILAPEVKEQIKEIISFELAHKKNKEGFDNILLTGLPGNGKTFVAKALAAELGMDYIILTGSSFFQENAGVKAIDQIFGKMTRGRKVIIFIDEIESLIGSRSGKNPDGDGYRLVNQLLNYTSNPNKNFILIGATNHSNLIDGAFHRRFQHVVEMPLPGLEERIASLTFFRDKQLITKKNKEQIKMVFSEKVINNVAVKTEGLSYAELQTIIDHIKSSSRLSKEGITKQIIDHAVSRVMNKEKTFNTVFLKK